MLESCPCVTPLGTFRRGTLYRLLFVGLAFKVVSVPRPERSFRVVFIADDGWHVNTPPSPPAAVLPAFLHARPAISSNIAALRRPPALEEKLHAWTKYHFKPQADHRCEVCTSLRVCCFCWLLREPANLQPVALRLRHPHVQPSVSRLHDRSTTNCRYVFHTNLWFTRAITCITCTRYFIFHQQRRRFVNYCSLCWQKLVCTLQGT